MIETPTAALAASNRRSAPPVQVLGGSGAETRSRTWPGVRIAVHADLAGVETVWRDLEAGAGCTAFQNFDYLQAWFRHIGAQTGVTPAVVVLRNGNRAIALLPLAVNRSGVFRRLSWLGQDLCDYLLPVAAPEFAELPREAFAAVWQEILALLQSHPRFRHDWIEFRRMPGTIAGSANPFLALATTLHASNAYRTTLGSDWETFYRTRRSAKARKQDRSKLARLTELGDVELVSPRETLQATQTLDALFEQKSETLDQKGIADVFRRPGYRAFFQDLATNPRTRDWVHVSALAIGQDLAAVGFGMEYRKCYSLFLVSYDRSLGRFSPGVIHLNRLMERAIARGMVEFDFLVGEQRLKREWTDRTIPLHDYIAATTWRGQLLAAPILAIAVAKRAIKQSPAFWRIFQTLRTGLGAVRRRLGR